MVTTIFIIGIVIGIIICVVGGDAEFFPVFLIGASLIVYCSAGIFAHNTPTISRKDFIMTELVQEANKMKCVELVLSEAEFPKCVTEERRTKDFKTEKNTTTFWPLGRWSKHYNVIKYRALTRNDLGTACASKGKLDWELCQESNTVVVIKLGEE